MRSPFATSEVSLYLLVRERPDGRVVEHERDGSGVAGVDRRQLGRSEFVVRYSCPAVIW